MRHYCRTYMGPIARPRCSPTRATALPSEVEDDFGESAEASFANSGSNPEIVAALLERLGSSIVSLLAEAGIQSLA